MLTNTGIIKIKKMNKKYYYIFSENMTEAFDIECESKAHGEVCYLAKSCRTGEEVWLYKDCIEYTKGKRPHKILRAYEVKNPPSSGFPPDVYVWGGQIRDKYRNSMCARPYFRRQKGSNNNG